jgi:mannose-6-phosphate isomerase-like protein (cupin superfamily)
MTGTWLRSLWVLGHRVTPIPVGSRVAFLEVVTQVGTPGPPPHYHDDCAEFFYVLSGRLGVMTAGEWSSLCPGGYTEVPRGTPHTFRNDGDNEARFLTGFDPPGFEKWFEEMGFDTEQPDAYEASTSETTLKRVAEESARYGMILVS